MLILEGQTRPASAQLRAALSPQQGACIRPPVPAGYAEELMDGLPDHCVKQWTDGTVVILPGPNTEDIVTAEERIYACARQFRQEATALMHRLAVQLGLDPLTWEGLNAVKMAQVRSGQRVLALDEAWTYHLHGFECRFEHTRTGQLLEVIVGTVPECGLLDDFFLHEYMRTTPAHQPLLGLLRNPDGVGKALRLLARRGLLTAVDNHGVRYWTCEKWPGREATGRSFAAVYLCRQIGLPGSVPHSLNTNFPVRLCPLPPKPN